MDDELEIMWKKGVVAYFKVLCRYASGGTEENHETLCHESWLSLFLPRTAYKNPFVPFERI
jgi:hypothetical protein